jgi:hypothetical protein
MRIESSAVVALLGLALLAAAPANAATRGPGGHAGQFGGMDPIQARRQNDINECARKHPSFDSLTKTFKGPDGRRHSCFE